MNRRCSVKCRTVCVGAIALLQERIGSSFNADRGWFGMSADELVIVVKRHDFCGNAVEQFLMIAAW